MAFCHYHMTSDFRTIANYYPTVREPEISINNMYFTFVHLEDTFNQSDFNALQAHCTFDQYLCLLGEPTTLCATLN